MASHRVLLLIGLIGCGSEPTPVRPPVPPAHVAPENAPSPYAAPAPPPSAAPPTSAVVTGPPVCAKDEWRGSDCRLATRPALGTAMREVCTTTVPQFTNAALFDPKLTRRYQTEIVQPKSDHGCCVSHCHPYDTPAIPPPRHAKMRPIPVRETCRPVPEAGATIPAAKDPACPATVVAYGHRQPFSHRRKGTGFPGFDSCCYAAKSLEFVPAP